MLGVQLSPDAGAEGVCSQALGQAAQELHKSEDDNDEKEGAGASGNNTSIMKAVRSCHDP